MKRIVTTAVVLVVLLSVATPVLGVADSSAVAGGSAVSAQTAEPTTTATTATTEQANESNTTETSPGARLGGVVAVQGAELGGEVESRSLSHQLNRSESNQSKAAVIARQTRQSQSRLDSLSATREELQAAHENGSISESEYRVRAAALSARMASVRRMSDQTATAATGLPNETLEANGVNVTAIRSLRSMAENLEGSEIAAIARDIAGPNVGGGVGPATGQRGSGASDNAQQGSHANANGAGDGRQAGASNTTTRGGANETSERPADSSARGGPASDGDSPGPKNQTNTGANGDGAGPSERGRSG